MRSGGILLVCLVGGCSLFGPSTEVRRGIIGFPDDIVAEVPPQASAGKPFQVSVSTVVWDCWNGDRADVVVAGRRVTVTPYDSRTRSGGVVCTTEVRRFRHTATIIVTETGEATVEFRGRDGSAFRSVVIVPAP